MAVWLLPLFYFVIAIIFGVFLGGAGHGFGIEVAYWAGFPATKLAEYAPDSEMIWMVIAGLMQWTIVGAVFDRFRSGRGRK